MNEYDRLKMRYIGICALVARIAKWVPLDNEDRYGIDRAMEDAKEELPNFDIEKQRLDYWFERKRS